MFFILISILSLSASASPELERLANSPKWHKLLHYKKTWTGGHRGEADGKDFYLHPQGKEEPFLELKRAVELFSSTEHPSDKDAACKFPARFKWLSQELGKPWKVDLVGCQSYLDFLSKLAAKRASIVFSSYYLSNPNSAFGHTLLRLGRFDDWQETEMLDYGINYAADARDSNPFSYIFKGLFGGYKGKFAAIPYYYKVREYSDHEFRDLWSYDLKLSPPQVLEMVDHIWELAQTDFDYYYFLENCSYHLLGLIEAVMPEKDLTSNYNLFTIPADTIRLLKKEGLIEEGRRRESTYSRLMRLSAGLDINALTMAKTMALDPTKTKELVGDIEDQGAAKILDIGLEAFDYYYSKKILSDDPKTMELKSNILIGRAQNPIVSSIHVPGQELNTSPADSHAPSRVKLGVGYKGGQGREAELEYRAAFHDLLDPPQGSLKQAQLEIAKLSFKYKERHYGEARPVGQELILVSLKNYPAQNFWSNQLSWELELGGRQLDLKDCFDCPAGRALVSVGSSLDLLGERLLLSLLVGGEFLLHDYFVHGYEAGIGPKLVARYVFNESWVLGLGGTHHLNSRELSRVMSDHNSKVEVELRHHFNPDLSFYLKWNNDFEQEQTTQRGTIGLMYFH